MQPAVRPLSACALLEGVEELEIFFDAYKGGILSTLRNFSGDNANASSASRHYHLQNHPTLRKQQQQNENNNNNRSPSPTSRAFQQGPLLRASDLVDDSTEEQQSASSPTSSSPNAPQAATARAAYRSTMETNALNDMLFGPQHGVLDVINHLFTRHGTSHTLLDAIEHLNLLIPNWHEARKKDDGTLMETPQMRMYAMRSAATTDNNTASNNNNKNSSSSNSPNSNLNKNNSSDNTRWRTHYGISDVCDLTGLKNDVAVVRLLERDRGFGTKLWKVAQDLDADSAPKLPRHEKGGFGDPQTKKQYGWRSRLKFATALRAIQDREFVSTEARAAVRLLEQALLPECSFEPHDLVNMSHALTKKLELEADKATREEMIADLSQQIRAIESFIRTLESDQQQMSENGEIAQLKNAAVQQLEWYERLLRTLENQFDVACDDVQSVEEARKRRNWEIFRGAKGDLPCVANRVQRRIHRLQSSAGRVRDLLHEKSFVYEKELEMLDKEIDTSTKSCADHLGNLTDAWNGLIEAIQKASAAEQHFVQLGASLRSTVQDRLDLIGARAMKDASHSSLLKSANDILIDFAEEVERLKKSGDFLSDLHSIVCDGSENITERYDTRREDLLKQAETIRGNHEQWMQEYSVALGRHRHRISSQLSDSEEAERKSEMRRELSSDLLDVHTRAHAIYRDEASTSKIRLKSELAALDGSFHSRNDEFRNRGVQLNLLRNFVQDLIQKSENNRRGKGGMLDSENENYNNNNKSAASAAAVTSASSSTPSPSRNNNNNNPENKSPNQQQQQTDIDNNQKNEHLAPLNDTTNVDLVNLTSLHHLEKEIRNKYELHGHSKEEQQVRDVMWERDRIQQAKESMRAAPRVPLGSIATATHPPPFLTPTAPSTTFSTSSASRTNIGRPSTARIPSTTNKNSSTTLPSAASYLSSSSSQQQQQQQEEEQDQGSVFIARPQSATTISTAGGGGRSRLGQRVHVGQVMRVVFPFEPRVEDELTLLRGDQVIVLRHGEDPGWAFGVCRDKLGQFPLNYTEPVPS